MKKIIFLFTILSFSLSSCKDESENFDAFIQEIQAGTIGDASATIDIASVSENLYKVTANVDVQEDIKQKGWAINITPSFKGDFHWTPHLTPTEDHIISDHAFRAPAMIMTSDSHYLAIIPDLDERAKSRNRWFMDMNAPENTFTLGMSDYVVREHVLFHKTEKTQFKKGKIKLSFYVMLSKKSSDLANPWRKPLAFMWENWGKPLANKGEPLNRPMDVYSDHTYNWAFNTWKNAVWQEFDLNGKRVGAPVFIVNYTQSPNYKGLVDEREFTSIWNNTWFSSLRSAQGLYRYGRRTNNEDYLEKARLTKELALAFPQKNGFFPGLIATEMEQVEINGRKYNRSKGWDTYYFGNSNRNPLSWDARTSPLNIVDMSFTAYLMLTWYDELEKDERLIEYATRFAEGLLTLQDEKGFFPAWITDDHKPVDVLVQSPGASLAVTFLLKLYELTKEEKYKVAALKAMDVVVEDIVPVGRWEDYETYWSCSKWGSGDMVNKKVERNNMYKQNTLSIYWTAEALLYSYEKTKDKKYLKMGQRTLDELLMTQALWEPPYMYVKVFGGFGVMNVDGEWNDSRQALFGELFMKYGELLGIEEYTTRGIAAVKSSFNMMYCPENPESKNQWETVYPFFGKEDYGFMMENYGHGGYTGEGGEGIGVFTIYDWGNGAAAEAYNRVVDHYGIEVFAVK